VTDALTLVVCGAPLAERAADVAGALVDTGWSVTVVGSPASREWLDLGSIEAATSRPVIFDQRRAGQLRGPRPAAVVACPLTMNSATKAATGIMDTYAAGVLVDAVAVGTPLTLVVTVSSRLWSHPAWAQHLQTLSDAGARFFDAVGGRPGPPSPVQSGSGPEVVEGFDVIGLTKAVGPPGS
jgi:phosphopantothenoylcysteine synthetase/decarboxylase